MRILNKSSLDQAANIAALTDTVEQAMGLTNDKEWFVPDHSRYHHKGTTQIVAPVFGPEIHGLKYMTLASGSKKQSSWTPKGTLQLLDANTGRPLALLDGASVNAYRNGALAALGIRHMAPKDATTLGIAGAGKQGYHMALAADAELKLDQIMFFDLSAEKANNTIEKLQKKLRCENILAANSAEELLVSSEIIITATDSAVPVLPSDKPALYGKTYIAAGSYWPNTREIPIELFEHLNKCIIDSRNALKESGDLIEPLINNRFHIDDMVEMSDFIKNKSQFELGETRLYKTTGSAVFDLLVARKIFTMADEKNLGIVVDF